MQCIKATQVPYFKGEFRSLALRCAAIRLLGIRPPEGNPVHKLSLRRRRAASRVRWQPVNLVDERLTSCSKFTRIVNRYWVAEASITMNPAILSERLRRLRTARGFTLERLAAAIGGVVTKQALSKYENGKDVPSPRVITRLAAALGVKSVELWREPDVEVELIAYRKRSGFTKTARERIESQVSESLERRVRLQELAGQNCDLDLPVKSCRVQSIEDAEQAAVAIRKKWQLGLDPIASVTGVLEDHLIHVIEIDAPEKFDGLSALARQNKHLKAAAVVDSLARCGERQRFNLAHELGHIVMDVAEGVDEEKAAFRFAGAFLAPIEVLHREVGKSRHAIEPTELLLLKRSFGMSMQAILYRLKELHIITERYFKSWFYSLSAAGHRKAEPDPLPREVPAWLSRTVLRALAERVLSRDDAQRLLGSGIDSAGPPLSLVERRAFMKLPLDERRQLIEENAKRFEDYYRDVARRGDLAVADVD